MKQFYFSIMLLLFGSCIHAQKKEGLKFSSINQFGILKGASDQTFQVQSVNGIQYKSWFIGPGIGIDNYALKTVPVFIDFRKTVYNKKQAPFIYADLGVSLPWKKEDKGAWQTSQYKTGLYYDVGIGYTVPVKKHLAFNFSAGYSQKQLHETRSNSGIIWDFPPYGQSGKEYFDYTFRRISVKMGLQF